MKHPVKEKHSSLHKKVEQLEVKLLTIHKRVNRITEDIKFLAEHQLFLNNLRQREVDRLLNSCKKTPESVVQRVNAKGETKPLVLESKIEVEDK